MATGGKYDPAKSQVGDDALADFIGGELDEDLSTVPGVAGKAVEKLAAVGITSTYQLIGKFLMLKEKGASVQDHCDAMWSFLQEIGVNAHRSGIIKALGEKLNPNFPGVYDESSLGGGK